MRPALALAVVGSLALVGAISQARADAPTRDDTATARLLFDEGRQFARSGDWASAADRFRRSLALRASPQVKLNLGTALVQLGSLVEASELLREAIRETGADQVAHRTAASLLESVEPRLGRLTVRVDPGADDVAVTLDGRSLSAARLGVANLVDPGTHRLELMRGTARITREVAIAEGGREEVVLVPPPLPPTASTSSNRVAGSAPSRRALWWQPLGLLRATTVSLGADFPITKIAEIVLELAPSLGSSAYGCQTSGFGGWAALGVSLRLLEFGRVDLFVQPKVVGRFHHTAGGVPQNPSYVCTDSQVANLQGDDGEIGGGVDLGVHLRLKRWYLAFVVGASANYCSNCVTGSSLFYTGGGANLPRANRFSVGLNVNLLRIGIAF